MSSPTHAERPANPACGTVLAAGRDRLRGRTESVRDGRRPRTAGPLRTSPAPTGTAAARGMAGHRRQQREQFRRRDLQDVQHALWKTLSRRMWGRPPSAVRRATPGEEQLRFTVHPQLVALLQIQRAAPLSKERPSKCRYRSGYRVDSISKPQASRRGSGIYFEFLLRRAHSRRRVERRYWSGESLYSRTTCSNSVMVGLIGPIGSGLPQFGFPRRLAMKNAFPLKGMKLQKPPYKLSLSI